jgi:fructuronate reductase
VNSTPDRLSDETLVRVQAPNRRPAYDRAIAGTGIVHLGPGAFHRGHEAVYADDGLALGAQLGICAVSLRSSGVRDALAPQDGLYTLAIADTDPEFRVIGSILEWFVAPEDPEAVCARLADPRIHTVSLTVTEKGYCLDASGDLDVSHPDIRADLAAPSRPTSAVGFIAEGLRRRRRAGIEPFAVVSCDNQSENGARLLRAVTQFAGETDPEFAAWIADSVAFPLTMVDSITPATDDATRDSVRAALGIDDAWPVRRERYTQWVVETGRIAHESAWASAGVTFDADVRSFETAKIRLLNGQHSALAYLGILAGHSTVAEAVSDPGLRAFVDALVDTELRPSLRSPANLDLDQYCRSLMLRFSNPKIEHRLEQIAIDGSQKIAIRILETVRENLAAGRPTRLLAMVAAAWLQFFATRDADGRNLDDPLRDDLMCVSRKLCDDADEGVRALLGLDALGAADLRGHPCFTAQLTAAYRHLDGNRGNGVGPALGRWLADAE